MKPLLFALAVCVAATAALARDGRIPLEMVEAQSIVAQTELIVLHSDKALSDDQKQWVLETAQKAYLFDLKQLGWDRQKPQFAKPFGVTVISRAMLSENHWTLGGATFGDQVFAINGRCLEDQKAYYTGVIAHELTHMLVTRMLGGVDARKLGWNSMMGEGVAIENGMRFRVLNEPDLYPAGRLPASKGLEAMTGADVEQYFANAATAAAHHDLDVGVLFIEFLRTHPVTDRPAVDVQVHWGNVLAEMAKNQSTYAAAFAAEFGVELGAAQQQFVEHMKATEGNPAARFAGTILMPRAEYKRRT